MDIEIQKELIIKSLWIYSAEASILPFSSSRDGDVRFYEEILKFTARCAGISKTQSPAEVLVSQSSKYASITFLREGYPS